MKKFTDKNRNTIEECKDVDDNICRQCGQRCPNEILYKIECILEEDLNAEIDLDQL